LYNDIFYNYYNLTCSEFEGYQADTLNFMRKAIILVLPSKNEGMSIETIAKQYIEKYSQL
jgi:hypothetical protein